MESIIKGLFELDPEVVEPNQYMPRVYDVNMPCQWLEHCYDGKCSALRRKNGNLYCAKKNSH
jgi:hypothetical protein